MWSFLINLKGIKDQIFKDVERTDPDLEFFNEEKNKKALIDVLTVWAGKNYDIQYRQGMNEIGALILIAIAEESLYNPYSLATDDDLLESYLIFSL